MCGIAGILKFDGTQPDEDVLRAMTRVLAHRGPDGEDFYLSGPVGLGHRRLSIIDLSPAGKQPMCNEDQSIWVVYNGEIYNFLQIRQELEKKGHTFFSRTDSEVIVHAYEEWGRDCLNYFNGMFAFALWDARNQQLWLVRDRLGVKPLFFCHLPNLFLFGSEIKAILEYPGIGRQIDYQALSYFLGLNYTPAPFTLFKSVRQLLPGHEMLVKSYGHIEDREYWDLQYIENEPRKAESYYIKKWNELMQDSIRMRLVSDVPFGAFLSGGIDSSTVTYWMSQNLEEPVKTFTIGFNEPSFDELTYARQMSECLNTEHHEQIINDDLVDILPKIVWHSEEPTADSSMVAVYYLAKMTRDYVTMVLSGDGADEILAGYETYQADLLRRLYQHFPAWLRKRIIFPIMKRLPTSDSKVSLDTKMKRFALGSQVDGELAHGMWRVIFDETERRELLKPVWHQNGVRSNFLELYQAAFDRTDAKLPLNRLLYADTRFYLPNDMLVKVDRMCMAHGLESREPFLDYRLVEFAAELPPGMKLRNFIHKKYLLKAAMRGKLPREIIWRKKAGFNVPNARWIKGGMKTFIMDHLSSSRIKRMGILDERTIQKILADHFNEKSDNSHQIWGLLTLMIWHTLFME